MPFQGILGVVLILFLAWVFSENRKGIDYKYVGITLLAQFALLALFFKVPQVSNGIQWLGGGLITAIRTATLESTSFVFGFLGGADSPFQLVVDSPPEIFAFEIIPMILVFSMLLAVLWHWRVLQVLIRGFSWVLQRTLGIGGAVGLAAASSLFLGMVEAPMAIRAYMARLTRGEFFIVLTCGMATVAGSIMGFYALMLADVLPNTMQHILTASIANIIGSILIARIMVPSESITQADAVKGTLKYESTIDAVTQGTYTGVQVAVNVVAMLLVLISLVALVDYIFAAFPDVFGDALSLARIMGWIFAPVAFCMGVPWAEATQAGALLGIKLALNEVYAFTQLAEVRGELTTQTRVIMTYALCGFTNLGSVGILIGGVGALVPERREDLLQLGPRTLISGTLVAFMTGTIAGILN